MTALRGLVGWLVLFVADLVEDRPAALAEVPDEELMRRYGRGEPGAFEVLFSRYGGILQGYLQRQLFRPDEAADVLQDVFLQVHRARRDYDPTRPLRPWLFTIARNLLREHFRRIGRRRESPALPDLDRVPDPAALQPPQEVSADQVRRALASLPSDQRDAIALHWLEGFSFPEVAEIVGASVAAVKVRAHRGYKVLARKLGS